jgi:hypothetical protein
MILKEFVQEKRAYVLMDHLDVNWSTENEQTCLLLAALIHEADRLNTYLTPGLRIIIFLRGDIFDVVKLKDSEIDKRSKDFIRWNETLLAEVVAKRIANAKGLDLADCPAGDYWYSIFCEHVGKEDTMSYIISRTLLRPRDVLQFCNRCLEEAQNKRHDYIQEGDVLRAERDYSEEKILDLYREYRISHPDLIELLWCFKGLPREVEERKIREIVEEARNNPESLKEASEWINDRSTEQLIEFLYDIGFLGVKSGDGAFVYSCDKSLEKATFDGLQMATYEEIERVAFALKTRDMWYWIKQLFGVGKRIRKEQRIFSVHPAFRKHLRILDATSDSQNEHISRS